MLKKTYRLRIDLVKKLANHAIEFDVDEPKSSSRTLKEYLDPAREARERLTKRARKIAFERNECLSQAAQN